MFEYTSISDNNLCYNIKRNEPFLIVMSSPEFHLAKVKEMHNGVVRVKGNANSINLFRMEGGFGGEVAVGFCVIGGIFATAWMMQDGENGLFESAKFGLGFFLVFLSLFLFVSGLLAAFMTLLRSLGNYYQKYWDDFTFDGVTVKSRKFQIDASEITFVRPRVDKSGDDVEFSASVRSGPKGGRELGRVVVDGYDIANMVEYLSSQFGVPLDEEGLEKFLKKEGITAQEEYHIGKEEDKVWNRRYGVTQLGTATLIVAILHSLFGTTISGLLIPLILNFAIVHNIMDYLHTKAVEKAIAAEKAL